ncbi:MAG: hypothetical protein EHM58_01375 [Ignavibacteriae bacterium]|nr:MAG: hypothetical protein EHM58_01375 [Ignavibacteriota bacterium]
MIKIFGRILYIFISSFITQEFIPEGYSYSSVVPFTKRCDLWFKGIRPKIRFRGKEWERQRNQYALKHHGMTWDEIQKQKDTFY